MRNSSNTSEGKRAKYEKGAKAKPPEFGFARTKSLPIGQFSMMTSIRYKLLEYN